MASSSAIFLVIISCLFTSGSCVSYSETDTLKQGDQLQDWDQLVSVGRVFRMGFFNPNPTYSNGLGPSGPRHLGIWFDRIPYYSVWVANRVDPIPDSSGVLTIDEHGKLKITHQRGQPIIINSDMAPKNNLSGGNFTVTLLDSGNLVVRQVDSNGIPGPILWQSFDYPHNMLLPGMKLGMNMKTGHNWTVTSWFSEKIPAPGAFRLGLDPTGANQLLVWRRDEIYWSSGEWQNGSFKSAPELTKGIDIYDFEFVSTANEKYFSYSLKNKTVLSRWDLDTIGTITLFTLYQNTWTFQSTSPCSSDLKNMTAVCLSEKATKCRKESDMFVRKRGYFEYVYKFYDGYVYEAELGFSDCHSKCWKNCTCIAYQSASSDGVGCKYWSKGSKFVPNDNSDFMYLLPSKSNK
ncbi:G-type lectin S-receptor-like serine/threonine-protein kinase CES101 [Euphorbia peplus]|nr:G-type lectin S-receptor-like serine/threonine-protein kinase CES101 [Euphorbia peplus]